MYTAPVLPRRTGNPSFSGAQEVLDRVRNPFAVADLAGQHLRVLREAVVQVLLELSAAVRALHLAVAEHVHAREQVVVQELHAALGVLASPVVAVRKVERIDVPLGRVVVLPDQLGAQLVRRRNLGPARLLQVEERLPVDFLGGGVMDDVARLKLLVLRAEPGVDPEGLRPDDLLLLVAHGARHVHHVDDHRRVLRQLAGLPRPIPLVLLDRDDHGLVRAVAARRHRALQRLAVGPLEMPEALRTDAGDAGILVVLDQDRAAILRLDERKRQLLAEDLGQLGDRQLHLEDVLARHVAAAGAALSRISRRDRRADVAGTLPDPGTVVRAVAERRKPELRERDGHRVLPLAADHLAVGDVLAKIPPDLPPDDLPEAGMILLDLLDVGVGAIHIRPWGPVLRRRAGTPHSFEDPLAKMLATNESTSLEQVSQ